MSDLAFFPTDESEESSSHWLEVMAPVVESAKSALAGPVDHPDVRDRLVRARMAQLIEAVLRSRE